MTSRPTRTRQETLYEGKTWLFPLYRFVYPMVYNKELVAAAGLDPEAPPTTWEELITGLEAIKKSGVTPSALGLKDGFGGEIIAAGQLEKQWVNAPQDVMQKVIEGDLQFPEWRQWIEKSFELKPYFNEDANSLGFAEATGVFQAGQAAMVAGGPGVPSAIAAMQEEGKNVGVFQMPAFGEGSWAQVGLQHRQRLPGAVVERPAEGRRRVPGLPAAAGEPGQAVRGHRATCPRARTGPPTT